VKQIIRETDAALTVPNRVASKQGHLAVSTHNPLIVTHIILIIGSVAKPMRNDNHSPLLISGDSADCPTRA
jgi:hypothetical protein